MVCCNKCYSNDIDILAWVNLVTNEITDRQDQYHCNNCGAMVDAIIVPDPDWIEDVEPINNEDEETQIIPGVDKPSKLLSDE